MRRASAVVVVLAIFLMAAGSTMAGGRPDKSWKKWFTNLAIGASLPESDYGDAVDDGWYIKGGAMLWPEEWAVGMEFTAAYTANDFSNSFLRMVNEAIDSSVPPSSGDISGGDVDVWSLETNVVWGPKTGGTVGFYLTGGVGIDFIEAKLTTTGLVYYPGFCSFYYCYPGGVAQGEVIKGSESATEFSYNAGIGIDFELNSGTKLYLEATYHSAQTEVSTDYIPIVFGVRF